MGMARLAIPKALKRAGMTQDQIGLWKLTKLLLPSLYTAEILGLPKDRVNGVPEFPSAIRWHVPVLVLHVISPLCS